MGIFLNNKCFIAREQLQRNNNNNKLYYYKYYVNQKDKLDLPLWILWPLAFNMAP